jgi:hypothetical protein
MVTLKSNRKGSPLTSFERLSSMTLSVSSQPGVRGSLRGVTGTNPSSSASKNSRPPRVRKSNQRKSNEWTEGSTIGYKLCRTLLDQLRQQFKWPPEPPNGDSKRLIRLYARELYPFQYIDKAWSFQNGCVTGELRISLNKIINSLVHYILDKDKGDDRKAVKAEAEDIIDAMIARLTLKK